MSKKQRDQEKEVALAREKEITEAQAKVVLEKGNAERVQRCKQKIARACAEENCDITADIIWHKGQLIPRPLIIPKGEGEKK